MGEETIFLLAYKFRIFNADDEIHFSVPIRHYRIVIASAICHLTQFSIICRTIIALYRFMLLEFSIQP
jgi:hypothetical protein